MKLTRLYSTLIEAQMAVIVLANGGIKAIIYDEALASVNPAVAYATGIRVMVEDGDLDEAKKILSENENTK